MGGASVGSSNVGGASVGGASVEGRRQRVRKLIGRAELAELGERLRREGRRVVFTNGCFDILHVGHLRYLRQARALGDLLVIGLNTDASVRRLKGPSRPVVSELERAELLAGLDCVDYVTLFDEPLPNDTIAALRPDVHAKGGDYRVEDLPEAAVVRAYGGEVVVLGLVPGHSTTDIIGSVLAGAKGRVAEGAPDLLTSHGASGDRPRAVAVIPARYASSRFPGKPLVEIAGKTMIEHVYRRASLATSLDGVWVATDDQRIYDAVRAFGGQVLMTREDHPSGTDRIAEAARQLEVEVVVNVQGDEPLLDPAEIDAVVAPFRGRPELQMSTARVLIADPRDVADPGVVKVVCGADGYALYFSRLPIPFYRSGGDGPHYKHLGLYAYRKSFLLDYAALAPTPLEQTECLEQLRVLENGHRILVVTVEHDAVSVDTPQDLERVRALAEVGPNG